MKGDPRLKGDPPGESKSLYLNDFTISGFAYQFSPGYRMEFFYRFPEKCRMKSIISVRIRLPRFCFFRNLLNSSSLRGSGSFRVCVRAGPHAPDEQDRMPAAAQHRRKPVENQAFQRVRLSINPYTKMPLKRGFSNCQSEAFSCGFCQQKSSRSSN